MDIVGSIESFFEMLSSYIEIIKGYVVDDEFTALLLYLYNCIPVELQAIFIIAILFLLVAMAVKLLKR